MAKVNKTVDVYFPRALNLNLFYAISSKEKNSRVEQHSSQPFFSFVNGNQFKGYKDHSLKNSLFNSILVFQICEQKQCTIY